MARVLIEKNGPGRVEIPDTELHHLTRVLRARVGEEFEGFTAEGERLCCRLEKDSEGWFGAILEELSDCSESNLSLFLAQALIKRDKFDWVVQKATELGVSGIIPLVTWRTEIQLDERRELKKLDRWKRIALEAVKQCGRARIPSLEPPTPLFDLLAAHRDSPVFALDEEGNCSLESVLSAVRDAGTCTVLIGPEGGWDERDRDQMEEFRIPRIKLGPRILRAETAPVVALTILQYELGDLAVRA